MAQRLAFALLDPAALGSIPGVPPKISILPRFINSAAAQSSGQQRLNIVDRTHLELDSGERVLQKNTKLNSFYYLPYQNDRIDNNANFYRNRNSFPCSGTKNKIGKD